VGAAEKGTEGSIGGNIERVKIRQLAAFWGHEPDAEAVPANEEGLDSSPYVTNHWDRSTRRRNWTWRLGKAV
jgi:hypothetical protein